MSTPLAVTIRDYEQGETIIARGAIDNQPMTLGIEEFPATQLWSNDDGLALIETATGKCCSVQTIDLEYLDTNDAWIDKYFNPICLGCWYWTCQTILKEGDKTGEAYSVRLVEDDQCEAPFHNEDD